MRRFVVGAWWALLTSLVAAQLVRDRNAVTMLLLCVPVWPLALVGLAWRSTRIVASVAALASLLTMWTPARAPEGLPGGRILRVVQWNTQWGGKHHREAEMLDALDAQQPDVVCLSEAPRPEHFEPSWHARHPRWQIATVENPPRLEYWYRLTVTSRYPVRLHSEWDLPSGHAALFEVAVPARPLRLLMVDLESAMWKVRSPSIERVANARVDLLLGDFNATARFRGFDALEEAGYRRAALWSGRWRATWPSVLPLLDIDHVWVRDGVDLLASQFFRSPGIDHRGQRASLRY